MSFMGPESCFATNNAAVDLVKALLFLISTNEFIPSSLIPYCFSNCLPVLLCKEAKRNKDCASCFITNRTDLLHKLQIPSNKMTGLVFTICKLN